MKRRISLVVGSATLAGATAALAIGGTHAFADTSMSASASSPAMSAEFQVAGLPAIALPTIDPSSLFNSAQQVAQSLGLPLPPLPINIPAANELISDPTGFVSGIASDPMGLLNIIDVSSILAPVQGVTGMLPDPSSILAMLPDPNALLGNLPGADLLNGLLGGNALSGVMTTVSGVVGNPTSLLSIINSSPLGNVAGILGDPTSILTNVTSNPTAAVGSVVDTVAGLDPTGIVSGLLGGGDPTGIVSSLLNTVAGVDPTGLVSGLLGGLGGNPLNAVTGIVSNPTGAVSGVLNTVAGLDPTGTLPSVVNTVTSSLGGITGGTSAQAQTTAANSSAAVNINVPALPQVALPALPLLPSLPAVGNLTSTVTNTLNTVTGTVNSLLGSVTSSLPVQLPQISGVTGNLTKSLPVSANVCLPVVGCL